MVRQSSLPKPDIGGTMSKGGRIAFVIFLIIVLSASVSFSFNSLSRKTYEFEYTEDYNGTGRNGYVFNGFNGNASITEIRIEHPVEKQNGEWKEAQGDVIAVKQYTINSDEYLQYIYIGKSVEYIEPMAFVYCKALRAFYVDENNPNYCSVNGVLYTKDMKEIVSYPICHCTQLVFDDVRAGGEVVSIGRENVEQFSISGKFVETDEDASPLYRSFRDYIKAHYSGDFEYLNTFDGFKDFMKNKVCAPYIGTYYMITSAQGDTYNIERFWTCDEKYEVPEGIERVAPKAFYKCDRLVSIKLPSTLKEIGDMAFFNCWQTSLITIPDGVEKIGNDAFSYCSNMKYAMFIPASVKSIGHHCFYKCDDNMLFYMGAESENDIELGGRWQPRSDNSFNAKNKPVWGAQRAQCDEYNNSKYAEDEAAAAQNETEQPGEQNDTAANGLNKKALYVLIALFIPCFAFIGLQIVRNVFKDDFLMTAKGRKKLAERKAENERIHQAYINGEFDRQPETSAEEETQEDEAVAAEESVTPEEETGEGGENDE